MLFSDLERQPQQPQVVQDNALARSVQLMSVHEKRLLWTGLCTIQRDDAEFQDFEINVLEYLELEGNKTNAGYKLMLQSAKNLPKRTIEIGDDKNGWVAFQWVSMAQYIPAKKHPQKKSVIKLRFHDALKPYLLQLKKNFNKLDLDIAFIFNSHHQIHLYEILYHDSFAGAKSVLRYELNDLRKRLGLGDKYPDFKNFRNLLARVQADFEQKGRLRFQFEGLRQGQQVTHVQFIVTVKALPLDKPHSTVDDPAVIEALIREGYKQNPQELLTRYGRDRVVANLEFAKRRIQEASLTARPIMNPGGFISSCVKQDLAALHTNVRPKKSEDFGKLADQLNHAFDAALEEHFNGVWQTLSELEQAQVHESMRETMEPFARDLVESANWEAKGYILVRTKYLLSSYASTLPEGLMSLSAFVVDQYLFTEHSEKVREKIISLATKDRDQTGLFS